MRYSCRHQHSFPSLRLGEMQKTGTSMHRSINQKKKSKRKGKKDRINQPTLSVCSTQVSSCSLSTDGTRDNVQELGYRKRGLGSRFGTGFPFVAVAVAAAGRNLVGYDNPLWP